MYTHDFDHWVIRVVCVLAEQDRLEVNEPAADLHTEVEVIFVTDILRPSLFLFLDLTALSDMAVKFADDLKQGATRQEVRQLLLDSWPETHIPSEIPVAQGVPVAAQSSLSILGKRHRLLLIAVVVAALPTNHKNIIPSGCVKSTRTRMDGAFCILVDLCHQRAPS